MRGAIASGDRPISIMAVTDLILSPIAGLRRAVGSIAWEPSVAIARNYILSLLRQIEVGQLRILDTNSRTTVCGKSDPSAGEPQTELRIHNDAFWVRMLLFADMVGSTLSSYTHRAFD